MEQYAYCCSSEALGPIQAPAGVRAPWRAQAPDATVGVLVHAVVLGCTTLWDAEFVTMCISHAFGWPCATAGGDASASVSAVPVRARLPGAVRVSCAPPPFPRFLLRDLACCSSTFRVCLRASIRAVQASSMHHMWSVRAGAKSPATSGVHVTGWLPGSWLSADPPCQ